MSPGGLWLVQVLSTHRPQDLLFPEIHTGLRTTECVHSVSWACSQSLLIAPDQALPLHKNPWLLPKALHNVTLPNLRPHLLPAPHLTYALATLNLHRFLEPPNAFPL